MLDCPPRVLWTSVRGFDLYTCAKGKKKMRLSSVLSTGEDELDILLDFYGLRLERMRKAPTTSFERSMSLNSLNSALGGLLHDARALGSERCKAVQDQLPVFVSIACTEFAPRRRSEL